MRSLSLAIEKGTGPDDVGGGPLGRTFFGLMLFAAGAALGRTFFGLMLFAAGAALGFGRLVSGRVGILETSRFDDWPANASGSWRGSIAAELVAVPRPRLAAWAFPLSARALVPMGTLDARLATLAGGLLVLLLAGKELDAPVRPLDGRWLRAERELARALVGLRELPIDDLAAGLAGRNDFWGFEPLPFDAAGDRLFVRAFGAGAMVRLDFASLLF